MHTIVLALFLGLTTQVQPAPSFSPTPPDEHIEYWLRTLEVHELQLVRKNAARMLGSLGNVKAAPALIQALKDSFHGVRLEAARALGLLGSEQALTPLVEVYQQDHDRSVRRAARAAVERIKLRQEYLREKRAKKLEEKESP